MVYICTVTHFIFNSASKQFVFGGFGASVSKCKYFYINTYKKAPNKIFLEAVF